MRTRGARFTITGRTKVIAVIGDPVLHSRSPLIHNAAFRALGVDFAYVAFHVAPRNLRHALDGMRALGIAGLNVTVPHKEKILPLLDRVTPEAKAIGAVNVVVRRGDALVGDNTDAEGFRRAVVDLGVSPRGKHVLLLGAGGSARAVAWALASGRARRITILNRRRGRAAALARYVRGLGSIGAASGTLGEAMDLARLGDLDLVVNCTSIGLDGRSMPPIDLAALPSSCAVYDLVYGDQPTPLVAAARRRRLRAADGRGMLVHQAARAFRSWTGHPAPLDVMRRAIEGSKSQN